MKFATVAETRNRLTQILEEAHRRRELVLVTRHGKPYAMIRPIEPPDLEALEWSKLGEASLRKAWEGEDDRLYDYL